MSDFAIPTILDWGMLQKQLNDALTKFAAAQPSALFGFPTDPIDGQIVILLPTMDWYQWQPPSWTLIG